MMNRKLLFLMASIFMMQFSAKAQYDFSQVEYWIGSGTDSCVLIVDFHDATSYVTDSSYVWGYLFNNSTDGETILNDIAAADINFSVDISSSFLNDVIYGNHSGIGGTNSFWWSTWSGTSIANLSMNSGISSSVSNGDIFACSFTDFSPAIAPGTPIPAYDPSAFTLADVDYFIGTGTDTAILVIDFQGGSESFAWGYVFSDSTTGENMLSDISQTDVDLSADVSSGYLTDITYGNYSGLSGNPNYWSTWSATNLGNWATNNGISITVKNGDLFGCSYTDFNPAIRPSLPQAVQTPSNLNDFSENVNIEVYPNPCTDYISITSEKNWDEIILLNTNGQIISKNQTKENQTIINVNELANGTYILFIKLENSYYKQLIIKQ